MEIETDTHGKNTWFASKFGLLVSCRVVNLSHFAHYAQVCRVNMRTCRLPRPHILELYLLMDF